MLEDINDEKGTIIALCNCLFMQSFSGECPCRKGEPAYDENIYDILVDRFNNGGQVLTSQVDLKDPTAYHGGDLKGIINKLDDLQSLGFSLLSLSPIMENVEGAYEGYQTEDFKKVEKEFGTLADLKKLVKEAHKRDMKIMLEFSPNYVAQNSSIAKDPAKQDWISNQPVKAEKMLLG
ncbi:alpha-amylase family glycosyl hydrolase [Virgibacillus sp. 179-BFC.A HS]|uniref:Alpha-amylase family glycosyl hydrolase n=1 Tax=Tigheibacillus jepli TaxID=3035914 RepID=A0ABU5CK50_9BACI|nr:alpha-amylase family glycosyl hydrolase [Virgibacillus sp. 179-BFC.A HS]MDY0406199.1 alpha-amylase family glycosyl hydrolase [Virgibacillus sp. 179-BFC.A HS]